MPRIPSRPLPGTGVSLSILGFEVPPFGELGRSSDEDRATLERARSAGVTLFDLGRIPAGEEEERPALRAFASGPPAALILHRSRSALGLRGGPPDPAATSTGLATSLRGLRDAGSQRLQLLLAWSPEERWSEEDEASAAVLHAARLEGSIDGWGIRTSEELDLPVASAFPPSFLYPRISLLAPLQPGRLGGSERLADLPRIGRDPLAGGLLDGSRLGSSPLSRGRGPVPLSQIAADAAPVLRLGSLTRGRARTLAQAALQYASLPEVAVAAVAPLPRPERLEEILGFGQAPPLTEEDLASLRAR